MEEEYQCPMWPHPASLLTLPYLPAIPMGVLWRKGGYSCYGREGRRKAAVSEGEEGGTIVNLCAGRGREYACTSFYACLCVPCPHHAMEVMAVMPVGGCAMPCLCLHTCASACSGVCICGVMPAVLLYASACGGQAEGGGGSPSLYNLTLFPILQNTLWKGEGGRAAVVLCLPDILVVNLYVSICEGRRGKGREGVSCALWRRSLPILSTT